MKHNILVQKTRKNTLNMLQVILGYFIFYFVCVFLFNRNLSFAIIAR